MLRSTRPGRRRPARSGAGELAFAVGFASGILTLAIFHALLASSDREIELVRSVRDLAAQRFVEEVDSREMIEDALQGMLTGLDRYSRFYGPEEIEALERETQGEYLGIGVVFLPPVGAGQIRFTLPGSPADRAGIRVGDRIVSVDGLPVEAMADGELRATLQAPRERDMVLKLEGLDGGRREVSLRAEQVVDPSVRHVRMVDSERGIGYMAILSFSHRTLEEFDAWLRYLSGDGLRALVLDLRSNPGGILDAAVQIADRFIDEGTIVSTRLRTETRRSQARPSETRCRGMPLVLLVDRDSASASEVLVGAIQDHRVGVIVGEPTYGKGAVQTLYPFEPYRAKVKLTTSYYLTPAGRRIERGENGTDSRTGITPDLLIETSNEARARVHGFLSTYSPPPQALPELQAWERAEGVELVAKAPPDPQLHAALELLRGTVPGPYRQHAD